jgi:hypothetical protein
MGGEMMKSAEIFNQCAIEQYGSRKRHKANIGQPVNKCQTFNILCQKKMAGALCAQTMHYHVMTPGYFFQF